jgi:hypothetical protein
MRRAPALAEAKKGRVTAATDAAARADEANRRLLIFSCMAVLLL